MKKSLIAAGIAAAIAAPAANAGVVVYGKIHASIDYIDTDTWGFDGEHVRVNEKAWYVASRDSRIGFKGTEDLGNGLSLIWKAETEYDLDDGGWGGGRNAYIGLTGDWGTFLYGRHDTPMKISTGKLDLFGDQAGDYNWRPGSSKALLGPGIHDVRAGNAIAYISPNWNGFTFAGAIVPGEGKVADPTNLFGGPDVQDGLADSYSLAGMYSNNGLYLAAAYEELMPGTVQCDYFGPASACTEVGAINPGWAGSAIYLFEHDAPIKKWRVGAGYSMNAFTMNFVYENQKINDIDIDSHYTGTWAENSYEADIWQISGAYDFGNNRIKAAYGENKSDVGLGFDVFGPDEGGKVSGKSTHWAIGWDHKLSKRTTVYAQYASMKADHLNLSGVDSDANGSINYTDYETSAFSMGMVHNF